MDALCANGASPKAGMVGLCDGARVEIRRAGRRMDRRIGIDCERVRPAGSAFCGYGAPWNLCWGMGKFLKISRDFFKKYLDNDDSIFYIVASAGDL